MTEENKENSGVEKTVEELEKLAAKADEYLNGWKRAKADYLNLKREAEENHRQTIQYANAALVAELLPIYNNLKLAMDHTPSEIKDNNWVKGVDHIKRQFAEFFKSLGIEEIKTVGEKFNPEFHESVEIAEKQDFESNVIYEEVAPGYTLHGKVVNPAKVKLAK